MTEVVSRRPELVRDTTWLAGADLLCIVGGLLGQAILAKALLRSDYGLLVVLIDAFAVMFLLVDAGLPTIVTRDVPRARHQTKSLVMQSFKIQAVLAMITLPPGLVLGYLAWPNVPPVLVLACAGIAILHVFSYAPRSALRALGEARQEAAVKVIERVVTTSGYAYLLYQGSQSPTQYALAFLAGVVVSLVYALYWGAIHWNAAAIEDSDSDILLSNRNLIISALPFAITLGIIPLIGRFEKLMLSQFQGTEDVAVFHVAYLAYLAGLTLPQALRASLLPIMGECRGDGEETMRQIHNSRKLIIWLIPIGLLGGGVLVHLLMNTAFPDYAAESYPLFLVLLAGWAVTMYTAPNYVAVQAGENAWKFTQMLFIGVGIALLSGLAFIPSYGVQGAVISSVIGALALGIVAVFFSNELRFHALNQEAE